MVVTARIEKLEDGKLVLKPDTDISRFVEQKRPRRVEVRLDDGRTISVDQRRKIFAIIRDTCAENVEIARSGWLICARNAMSSSAETILRKEKTMKFERSEIGALFSKLRTAVPEVRAVGNDSTGILLSGPDAFATNLELSIRAELSSPVPQGVVIPPRGVDFISGAVAPEININVTKSGLVIESGTARARLSTTPAENYPTFDGPGKDAKRCVVRANDLSWAISKVLYAVSKEDRHPAHKGLCFSHNGDDTLEICALDGYRMAISRIDCTADGDFKFVLPAATAKAIDTLGLDGSVSIERDRKKAVFSDNNFEVKSRLIAEPFLDYSKIAAQKSGGTRIVLDRKELLGVLGRVKLARSADAKEKSTLVMDLEPGGTGRASMRSTIAQMNEEFSFNGKLDERLRIGFNLEFLSEALKSMEGDEVSALVVGPLSPVKLIEPQYEALVLPVKVKEEA